MVTCINNSVGNAITSLIIMKATISIGKDEFGKLREYAFREGRTISGTVRKALQNLYNYEKRDDNGTA